ncbi:MAG TPA: S8 family serine peptidase [bacterium]|nr:S8 family serine peptidase [bacterium]
MKVCIGALVLFISVSLLAVDACYYGAGKKFCMTRVDDTVSYRGGAPMKLTGELGIRFADGTSEAARRKLLSLYLLSAVGDIEGLPQYVRARPAPGGDVFAISRRLVESGRVKWAQPVWYERPHLLATTPNDTYYGEAWHHGMIHSPEAWDIVTGDPRVVLGIVDCGTDTQHPDLFSHMLMGNSFASNEPYVDPDPSGTNLTAYSRAHGTAVAGVATATGNNGFGVVGVCWDCGLLPVKYFGNEMIIPNDRKLAALTWTVDNGAWVINNSWLINQDKDGDTCKLNIPYDNYAGEAVAYGKTNGRGGRGTVMVFGAGNSACDTQWNDNFKNLHGDILVVSALRSNGEITDYSNYGIYIDISAPSGFDTVDNKGLVTTDWTVAGMGYNPHFMNDLPDQSYTKFFNGTSGAAPVVTGAIGLMLSVAPYLTHAEVIACVKQSAAAGTQGCIHGSDEECYGAGVLDVQAMVENAKNGLCGGTPECDGPEDCGEGECWNGICVEAGTVTDDDVMPDDTVPDEAVTDDAVEDDVDATTGADDMVQPDQPTVDDTPVTDEPTPDADGQNDETPGTDAIDPVNDDNGCGCSLL